MLVNFENYGNFNVTLYYSDLTRVTTTYTSGCSLREAMTLVEVEMYEDSNCINADIFDIYTGEIVATIERDEDEDPEEDWYRDEYLEEGYNPYMGCYDFDC